jgi:hypothetical protein
VNCPQKEHPYSERQAADINGWQQFKIFAKKKLQFQKIIIAI